MFSKVFVVIFAIVATIAAKSVPDEKPQSQLEKVSAQVSFIQDIDQFRSQNPDAKLIPLKRDLTRGNIRYTLGSRASGDRLVATVSDSYSWSSPQNIELRIQYPVSGQGAKVSYAEILVSQSTNSGRAYVLQGGVGYRNIVIIVEAYGTTYFQYSGKIYGI